MAVGKLRALLNYVVPPTALLARKVVRKNTLQKKETLNLKKKKKLKLTVWRKQEQLSASKQYQLIHISRVLEKNGVWEYSRNLSHVKES